MKPACLTEAAAKLYLGTTQRAFKALKDSERVKPLPVLGSYSVKHLDALIAELEKALEDRSARPPLEASSKNDTLTGIESDKAPRREVHDVDQGEWQAPNDLRPNRGTLPKAGARSREGSGGVIYPDLV